jgi:hypothetical protein
MNQVHGTRFGWRRHFAICQKPPAVPRFPDYFKDLNTKAPTTPSSGAAPITGAAIAIPVGRQKMDKGRSSFGVLLLLKVRLNL